LDQRKNLMIMKDSNWVCAIGLIFVIAIEISRIDSINCSWRILLL
jgi:hypothetical protein